MAGESKWLFLHHFAHTLSAFLVSNVDKVNTRRQCGHVDLEFIALALHVKNLLAEHVDQKPVGRAC